MSELTHLKAAVARQNYVVLDTETTGLNQGEIVQIAILDAQGNPLLNTLVKPVHGIPLDAQRIHGITPDTVATAPTFTQVAPDIRQAIEGKDVIVYNAVYDRRMLHQSAEAAGLPKIEWKNLSNWYCVMLAYAEFWGDWKDYHHSYRWQRLTTAIDQQGLTVVDAHSALGDCLMTLALIQRMTAG